MSLSNYIRRTKGEDREDINRLLGVMSDIFYPEPEEGSVQERIVLGQEKRIRTLTLTSGVLDVTAAETKNRHATEAPTLQMPTVCESYPFIHTNNGTFVYEKTTVTKFGGGAIFNGSTNDIEIAFISGSDLDLSETDAFTIAMFVKRANLGVADVIATNRTSLATASQGWTLYWTGGGNLRFEISDGTNERFVQTAIDQDDDLYHSVVITKSTVANESGMKIYLDGSLVDTGGSNALGSITNTNKTMIGDDNTGGSFEFTGSLSWFMILKEEVNATWVTGFNNGFFDWSGGNLVTSIPFVGDETPWTEATSPFCTSS